MSYQRPSFNQLLTRINADLSALPRSLTDKLAAMWARACHSIHGYLDWIGIQNNPLTCDIVRLRDWATLYNTPQLAATFASGSVVATGTAGSYILADSLLRGRNGLDYKVLASAAIAANGQAIVKVRCLTAGYAGNIRAGLTLTLVTPVVGVISTLTVGVAGITAGADDEDVEAWRGRVVDEWQAVVKRGGRGGSPADYIAWAKAAHPAVNAALVQPHAVGVGTVVVRPVCNGYANRLPPSQVLQAVGNYLALYAPATADWRVVAPIPRAVTINIGIAPTYDSDDNRDAVRSKLEALIFPKVGNMVVLDLADIDAAIMSVVPNFERYAPLSNVTAAPGEVFVPTIGFFNVSHG